MLFLHFLVKAGVERQGGEVHGAADRVAAAHVVEVRGFAHAQPRGVGRDSVPGLVVPPDKVLLGHSRPFSAAIFAAITTTATSATA